MEDLIARILLSAAGRMWQREPTLAVYTGETAEHELNVAFHFAAELRAWFPWLDCDFDVTKPNFEMNRPDIILHRRREHAGNFLVVEIKREVTRNEAPHDLTKIRRKWFRKPLLYRFGSSLIIDEKRQAAEATVLSRANPDHEVPLRSAEMKKILQAPEFSRDRCDDLLNSVRKFATTEAERDRSLCDDLHAKMSQFYEG
jgi:hypothetical protein